MSGTQSSLFKRVFVRSQISSARTPHSCGHGLPPKLSRREIMAIFSSGRCVQVCRVVLAFRWHLRKADLKPILVEKIFWFGYFCLAAMAQFTIRRSAFPNMQGK